MNQLGLFHLALSKNAGYPILWQVWCGNYDQSLGCGLPFFLTNLGRHPLGHPQSSIARETMYSCPQTRHTSTPHSGMQSLKNSPTKMKCWGIIKSLKIDLWMLDHLMFGLPSLFFCRIRLVELVKSKANFRPRLWTLNSTSAKPYDFTLNILTFRTSQAVSADAIGAPVQDIQIWSNQICTNIKCSLSSSHQSRAITGHAETDMDQPQAMLEAKTPVHRNKPFVAPVTSTRHIGHWLNLWDAWHCWHTTCPHGIKTTTGRFSKQTGQLLLVPCGSFLRLFRSGDSAFHIALIWNLLPVKNCRLCKGSKPITSSFCIIAGNCSSKHVGLRKLSSHEHSPWDALTWHSVLNFSIVSWINFSWADFETLPRCCAKFMDKRKERSDCEWPLCWQKYHDLGQRLPWSVASWLVLVLCLRMSPTRKWWGVMNFHHHAWLPSGHGWPLALQQLRAGAL